MRFKNLHTQTCKIAFSGRFYYFNGIENIEDKNLIQYLKKAPDFVCLDVEEEEREPDFVCLDVEEEEREPDSVCLDVEEEGEPAETSKLEELKKEAADLGIKFQPNIGIEKLQGKINEHLKKDD
jgi:hypothetical protein